VNQELSWVGRADLAAQGTGEAAMVLGAWRRSWLAYSFDRYGGAFSRRLIRLGESLPICGFGAVEKTREHGRMFFCLYRWGGRIWFQAGDQTWRLDSSDLRMSYRLLPGAGASEFCVMQSSRVVFRCSYAHRLRGLFTRADATRDNIDFEGRHFLAHVAGHELPVLDSEAWHDGKGAVDQQTPENVRQAIRDHLKLLADLVRQQDYERQLQSTDAPAELFYAWLEDSYRPSSSLFQQAFAPAERELLRRFTTLLHTASWEIGEVADIEDLQTRPIWARVVLDAEQTLSDLPVSLPASHH
jgi:hypothetical protein